uniref:NADH-ubiquinone oxidoreductase chain 3 n=1 Tax=Microbotryum cf. violaceum BFL-2013 TaxID=1288119 RepID=M1GMU6_9BASI|nr:NADH dehydrogenase subunit 3 [Microbotryum cf. violaceum BFL-2013]AGE14616.1 NADH dehydrogenase subunit 3 [Microbotryum cf. violaceum BFL-2013]
MYGQVRAPFAIQYYLVGILFLIFDLEIAVLYPLAVTLYQVTSYGFWVAMIFLIFLTVGFVYEFSKGALKFTDHRSSINRTPIENTVN